MVMAQAFVGQWAIHQDLLIPSRTPFDCRMVFQVDIVSIGGNTFSVEAFDDWYVWNLTSIVQKVVGPEARFKLITADGVEMLESCPLSDFCLPCGDAVQITLVKMGKSEAELEWKERWLEVTPDWLQKFTMAPLTGSDLAQLQRMGLIKLHPGHDHPHPTRVGVALVIRATKKRPSRKPTHGKQRGTQPECKTCEEILATVAKHNSRGHFLNHLEVCSDVVELGWQAGRGILNEIATLEAMIEAIVKD